MRKRIIVGLSILSLILILGVVLKVIISKNPGQTPTLRAMLGGNGCHQACWKGFEPFVASRDSVENWLNDSGQNYSVVTMGYENDTLLWNLTDEHPLVESSANDQSTITMEFSKDNFLWRIALRDIHICADTVISAYGIPPLISVDEQNIQMGYPKEGLLFSMHKSPGSISYVLSHIFITSSEWVEYFASPNNQSWEKVSDILNVEACEDVFSNRQD
jgi:hypothetical protein